MTVYSFHHNSELPADALRLTNQESRLEYALGVMGLLGQIHVKELYQGICRAMYNYDKNPPQPNKVAAIKFLRTELSIGGRYMYAPAWLQEKEKALMPKLSYRDVIAVSYHKMGLMEAKTLIEWVFFEEFC